MVVELEFVWKRLYLSTKLDTGLDNDTNMSIAVII